MRDALIEFAKYTPSLIWGGLESPKAALEFLNRYRQRSVKQRVPRIFYISVRDEDQPLPVGAFGPTNRPDVLVHLVIDALERTD